MNKSKLPKDWIVVNSKSHPDRVYYFNVKTNQSSWNEPTDEKSGEATSKSDENSKTRRKSIKVPRPSTPEHDLPEKTVSNRKKLTARRSIAVKNPAEESNGEEKETPQMRALREKILKKKGKNISSKSSSTTSENKTNKSLDKDKTSTSTSESSISIQSGFTPQMQVIYEKIRQRASTSTPKTKAKKTEESTNKFQEDESNKVAEKKQEVLKLRRPRSQSIISQRHSIAVPVTCSEQPDQNKYDTAIEERATLKKRSTSDLFDESKTVKKTRKSIYKKNLGKERMEKVRKCLSLEKKFKSPESTEKNRSASVSNYEASESIYKNVEVRLVRLKDKLLKDKVPLYQDRHDGREENTRKSQKKCVTTVDDLAKQSYENSYCEEMDWEPMEDEEITFQVQAVRSQLYAGSNMDVTSSSILDSSLRKALITEQQEKQQLYIVIDTNVFLSDIQTVDLAMNASFKTYDRPIIVIPYTVIRELDYIKDDKLKTKAATLCAKARRAIQYIHNVFSSKHPRVIGQRPEDVARNKEKFATDCPDDEILQTCLQIRDLGKSVVLLSYDKNLCNKAMIYDLVTLGRDDPFEKVDYLNMSSNGNLLHNSFNDQTTQEQNLNVTSIVTQELRMANEIFEDVKTVLKEFLTVIVSKEMRELYGENWEKYVIIPPPWTVITVLQCAVKHWIAAVSESFSRKAEILLKELLQILNTSSGSDKHFKDVGVILEKCNDLIQMVNIEKHSDIMIRVSHKIDELRKSLLECETQISEKKLRDAIGIESNVEEQLRRAENAFKYFEAAYAYARDMCGLAAEAVGMPCTIPHETPNPLPSLEYVKQIQPELAANVNRLLHNLSAVVEQLDEGRIDHRSLISLYQTLVSFLPDSMALDSALSPLDVYCCVKQKEQLLKAGIRQLQELGTHFCRLASYRCT